MKYMNRQEFEKVDAFGIGAPNDACVQYLLNQSFFKPMTGGKTSVGFANKHR